jgi:hypothetical protein
MPKHSVGALATFADTELGEIRKAIYIRRRSGIVQHIDSVEDVDAETSCSLFMQVFIY